MITKILYGTAKVLNVAVLTAMVGVGAYSIHDAHAENILRTISDEDRYCLQQNVYFEARNQSDLGREAVAWVTLNRVEDSRYPTNVCDVVWQRRQFSWTHDGRSDEPNLDNVLERKAWEESGEIVNQVLEAWASGIDSPVGGAVMFHASYTNPRWRNSYDRVAQIDDHIFYE